jgi:hypothetical protein
MTAGKADDLARYRLATRLDGQPRADRHRMDRPCDLDHEPAYRNDATEYFNAVDIADSASAFMGGGRHHGQGPTCGSCRPINHPLGLLLNRFH